MQRAHAAGHEAGGRDKLLGAVAGTDRLETAARFGNRRRRARPIAQQLEHGDTDTRKIDRHEQRRHRPPRSRKASPPAASAASGPDPAGRSVTDGSPVRPGPTSYTGSHTAARRAAIRRASVSPSSTRRALSAPRRRLRPAGEQQAGNHRHRADRTFQRMTAAKPRGALRRVLVEHAR